MFDGLGITPRKIRFPGELILPEGMRINRVHPLAHRLEAFFVPTPRGGIIDLAMPQRFSRGIGSPPVTGETMSFRGPGCGAWDMSTLGALDLNFTGPFSVALCGNFGGTPAYEVFSRSNGSNAGWELGAISSALTVSHHAAWFFKVYTSGSGFGGGMLESAITAASTAGETTIMGTADGTTRRLYVNGGPDASTGSYPLPDTYTASSSNGMAVSNSTSPGWAMHVAAAWSRCLTAEEARLFHIDPMCVLEPMAPLGMELFPLVILPPPPPNGQPTAMFSTFPP